MMRSNHLSLNQLPLDAFLFEIAVVEVQFGYQRALLALASLVFNVYAVVLRELLPATADIGDTY
jgi:hypothetical protein